jgi:RimJ/RimL family protein N-acetyltransferase
MSEYFLRSPRLGFRCWRADDLELAHGLWGDPEVTALIGGPFSAEQVQQRLDREIATMREHGVQYWPIFLFEDGAHAGCCGLRPYGDPVYELGFHLRRAFWRRGLAEEAGRAVVRYAAEVLKVRSLFAGRHPENDASGRVLAKLGFERTGEEYYGPTKLLHHTYHLSM